MGKLFGTNGVRGKINKDLSLETLALIAKSSAYFLGEKLAVGRDSRTTSPMIRDNVVSAVVSIGCNVYDMGVLPTPCLQYMTNKLGLDGGIMITASHNPPEFNGVKVIASDGVEVPRVLEDKIEELYDRGGPPLSEWDKIGRIKLIAYGRISLFIFGPLWILAIYFDSWWWLLIEGVITGFPVGLAFVGINTYVLDISHEELRGTYTGLMQFFWGITTFIGSLAAGIISDVLTRVVGIVTMAFIMFGAIAGIRLIFSLGYLFIDESLPKEELVVES